MSEPRTRQLLKRAAAPGAGYPIDALEGDHVFTATVVGDAAVSATVVVEGSNDLIGYSTIATLTLSGTATASGSASTSKSYRYWRANVTAISGGAVSVTSATEEGGAGGMGGLEDGEFYLKGKTSSSGSGNGFPLGGGYTLAAGDTTFMGFEEVPIPPTFPLEYELADLKLYMRHGPGGSRAMSNKTLDTLYPGWRTAPKVYCDVTAGSNGSGASAGAPINSLTSVIPAANALGVPIVQAWCKGGVRAQRGKNFSIGPDAPTCVIIWIAYGGRHVVSTDDALTWANDESVTTGIVQKATRSNSDVYADLLDRTQNGLYPRFPIRASAADVGALSGVYTDNVSIWAKRPDGIPVSDANFRAFLGGTSVNNFYLGGATQYGAALIGETENDGWDLEGGYKGVLRIGFGTAAGNRAVVYAKNCRFNYGGAKAIYGQGNIAIEQLNGALILDSCDVSGGSKDLINIHNTNNLPIRTNVLLLNCTGFDGGLVKTYLSNNFLTTHDTGCAFIAVGCTGGRTRGVTAHFIGDGDIFLAGCEFSGSLGDIVNGGVLNPCELTVADTVRAWIYKTRLRPTQACNRAIRVAGTANLFVRDCPDIYGTILVDSGATLAEW